MIATMYSVKCSKCGGDNAPILNDCHISEEHCQKWRETVNETLERIQESLIHKINSKMPSDNIPDSIAIPALNRLEARNTKVDEAFTTIFQELNR